MNRESIREYGERQRERYLEAGKKEKGRILDEVIAVTGYHRKAAIRLLRGRNRRKGERRPGRPRVYGEEVARAARVLYEATGGIGTKRLQPFMGELIGRLETLGELDGRSEACQLLERASAATLDRLRAPSRIMMRRRVRSLTKPGTMLRKRIPVRMFSEWDDDSPGFLEIDTVAHCGDSVAGFYLCTVTAVDVATGWIDMEAVWGKTEVRVGSAIRKIRRRMPVPLLGIDSDNVLIAMSRARSAAAVMGDDLFVRPTSMKYGVAGRPGDGGQVIVALC